MWATLQPTNLHGTFFGCQAKSFKSEHFNYPGLAGSLGKVMEAHSLKKTFHMFQTNPPSIFQARCSKIKRFAKTPAKKCQRHAECWLQAFPGLGKETWDSKIKEDRWNILHLNMYVYIYIYICYIYLNPCYWYCWCFKVMLKATIYGRVIIVIHGHVLENIWGLPK